MRSDNPYRDFVAEILSQIFFDKSLFSVITVFSLYDLIFCFVLVIFILIVHFG